MVLNLKHNLFIECHSNKGMEIDTIISGQYHHIHVMSHLLTNIIWLFSGMTLIKYTFLSYTDNLFHRACKIHNKHWSFLKT